MKNQKTYTTIQLILFGSVIFANPLERETEKAYCIKVTNGKYVGKTSDDLWIPKSIVSETEKVSKPDVDNVTHITKQLTIPEWFARKNNI